MCSAAFVPGRSLYLKMKLFLKRQRSTKSHGLLKLVVGLAAEADDEVAGNGGVGIQRRFDPVHHLAR